jgi:PAS domain S-box-containing protein
MLPPFPLFSPRLEELLDRSPIFLAPNTNLVDAYWQSYQHGYGLIEKSGQIPCVLTLGDLLRAIEEPGDRLTVDEIATGDGDYLREQDYEDIFSLGIDLRRKKQPYIPVIGEQERLLGVITPSALVSVLREYPIAHSTTLGEILTPRPVIASPETPIREIVRLMNAHPGDVVVIVDPFSRPIGYLSPAEVIPFLDRCAGDCMKPPVFGESWESVASIFGRWPGSGRGVLAIDGEGKLTGTIGDRQVLQLLKPSLIYHQLEAQKERAGQSEEQLRLILDNAPSYIYIIDEYGIVHFINRVPKGMTEEQVIGHHALDAVKPESQQIVMEAIERVFRTGETVTHEKSAIGDYHGLAYYQTRMARFDHPRLGKAAIVITTDITDLKNTEIALRQTEEQFRQLAENLPEIFYIYNLEPYRCLYVSPAFENRIGCPRRVLFDNPNFWLDRVHPDDRSRVERAFQQEFQGHSIDDEYRMYRTDGQMIWVHDKSIPIFDEHGRVKRVVGFVEDITERVRLKIALQQVSQGIAAYTGEDFFCSLVRYLAEALGVDIVFIGELLETFGEKLQMIAVYGDGQILANFECSTLNTPCQKVIGYQVQHYPDRVRERFPKAQILQEMKVEGYLGIPLWTVDHQPLGILGIFHRSPLHDIALPIEILKIFAVRASAELERRAATKALEKLNQELESRVVRRTGELEALLKEIHHRVKNNLNVMSHLLEWQARLIPDPKTRAIFQESQDRIQTMALIHDQLYQTNNLAEVNLAIYIERLANNIFLTYGHRTERYQLVLDLQSIELSLDKAIPCGLILNELLTNAFKYAFPDGRSGQIKIVLSRSNPRSVHLQVQDDGVGIPEQIDWDSSHSLGLKLIHILTKQLDGMIELERGTGTSFHLVFPA